MSRTEAIIKMDAYLAKDREENSPGHLFMFYPEWMDGLNFYQGIPLMIIDKELLEGITDPVEVEVLIRKK